MREPRVLMVAFHYPPEREGLARQTHLLARTLAARNVEVCVLTQRRIGEPATERLDGVEIVRCRVPPFGGFRTRAYPFMMGVTRHMLRLRGHYDVVHVNQALQPAAGAVALAKALGVPAIVKVAGGGDSGNIAYLKRWWPSGAVSLRVLHDADAFVSVSSQVTAELRGVGIRDERIVELPNGVDTARFAPLRARRDVGTHVVTATRLSHEKGVDVLIDAWAIVAREQPAARLTILGGGPDREQLVERAASLGITDSLVFAGEVDDVTPHLARGVFVLPSRFEGMSNALLEAMAAGCPVIASDIDANRQLVEHGVNGLTFCNESPADLAARILELLGDPTRALELGTRAAATVDAYSIEAVATRYCELYDRVRGA